MSGFVTPVASWGGGFFFNLTSIFTGVGLVLTKLIGIEQGTRRGVGWEANLNASLASQFWSIVFAALYQSPGEVSRGLP